MNSTWYEPNVQNQFMKSKGLVPSKEELDKFALGYNSFALGPPERAEPEAHGWTAGAGGIYSTASDLARWDVALSAGAILKPDSYRFMTTPRTLTTGKISSYGCGLNIMIRNGETILRHGGAVSGFVTSNSIVPRTRSAVVVMMNSEQPSPGSVADLLLGLLLEDEAQQDAPSIPKIKGPPPNEACLAFLHQVQEGELDRDQLGEEFSVYMNEERLKAAKERLKPLGDPQKIEVRGVSERGGMQVAQVRLVFKDTVLVGLLYRSPDGKIQQMLFSKE
jgi:hypothetical protein